MTSSTSGDRKKRKRVRKRKVKKKVYSSSAGSTTSNSSSEKKKKKKKIVKKSSDKKEEPKKEDKKKKKKSSSYSASEEVKPKKSRRKAASSSSGEDLVSTQVDHGDYVKVFKSIESEMDTFSKTLEEDKAAQSELMTWVSEVLKPCIKIMRNEFMTEVNLLRDSVKSKALDSRTENIEKMTEINRAIQTLQSQDKERRALLAENRSSLKAVTRSVKDQRSRMAQAVEEIGASRLDGTELREASAELSTTVNGNRDKLADVERWLASEGIDENLAERKMAVLQEKLRRGNADIQAKMEEMLNVEIKQACATAAEEVRAQEASRAEIAQQRRLAALDPSFVAPDRVAMRKPRSSMSKPKLRNRTVSIVFKRRKPMVSLARKIDERDGQLKQIASRLAAEERDSEAPSRKSSKAAVDDDMIDFAPLPSSSSRGIRLPASSSRPRQDRASAREARKARVAAAKTTRKKKKKKKASTSTTSTDSDTSEDEKTEKKADVEEEEEATKKTKKKGKDGEKSTAKAIAQEAVSKKSKRSKTDDSSPEEAPAPPSDDEAPPEPEPEPKPKKKRKFGASERCVACDKLLYAAEKIEVSGKGYHKMGCFKCVVCSTTLKLTTYAFHDNVLYCKTHAKSSLADGSHAARAQAVADGGGAAAQKAAIAPKVDRAKPTGAVAAKVAAAQEPKKEEGAVKEAAPAKKSNNSASFWDDLNDEQEGKKKEEPKPAKKVAKKKGVGDDFWSQLNGDEDAKDEPKQEEPKPAEPKKIDAKNKQAAKDDEDLLAKVNAALESTKTSNSKTRKKWGAKKGPKEEDFGDDLDALAKTEKKKRRSKKSKKGNKGGGLFGAKTTTDDADDLFTSGGAGGEDMFASAPAAGGGLFDLDFDDDDDLFK